MEAGDVIDAQEVDSCRQRYRSKVREVKDKALARMQAEFVSTAQGRSECWELLNKLRSPENNMNITPEDMCSHFEEVYFKQGHPPLLRLEMFLYKV